MRDISLIASDIKNIFADSIGTTPPMTLRGGDAIDSYNSPPPFDPQADQPTDSYIEQYSCGFTYLDTESWLYYLPRFLTLALVHVSEPSHPMVEALLWNLRPPDREPPRLGALTSKQKAIVLEVLEFLAFAPESMNQDFAMQVMEEYWIA
jgi:hypothetical protein